MADERLINTATRLPGRKGAVVIENMTRDPAVTDRKYSVGTLWMNVSTAKVFTLVDNSPVTWREISATSSSGDTFQTDSGTAMPVGGVINFLGGNGLSSSGSSNTVTFDLDVPVDVTNGGTGQTSYTNGQLLIGNSTGNTLTKATLTAGTGISVSNGTGTITINGINATDSVKGIASFAADDFSVSSGAVSLSTDVLQQAVSDSGTAVGSGNSINILGGSNITTSAAGSTLTISSSGSIGGSTGATDNRILRADGVGGSTLQNSSATVEDNGSMTLTRSSSGVWFDLNDGTDNWGIYNNAGTPESVIAADIGSICSDTTNGSFYIKSTDTVNTGWIEFANGDVVGPASATDNALSRYDGTTGKLLQNSTVTVTDNGEMVNTSQPAFYAFFTVDQVNVTGDGTIYSPVWDSTRYNQGNNYSTGTGIFTAPVDGKYWFLTQIQLNMLSGSNGCEMRVVTSNKSYEVYFGHANALSFSQTYTFKGGVLADMEAGDTALVTISSKNGALDNSLIALNSAFEGVLIC